MVVVQYDCNHERIHHMNNVHKLYIGKLGWNGTAIHAVSVFECDCDKFEKTHSHSTPYATCAPNTGMHYSIGTVNSIKTVEPTLENVTCKKCIAGINYRNGLKK